MNQKAWESAGRASDWLVRLIDAKCGSLRGATDLRAYYKTPAALLNNGRIAEADLVLDYIEQKLLLEGGDLDGEGVPWFSVYRTYPHSWICCAAMMRGRFGLAHRLSEFIATFHNPASGGFYAGEARDVEEVMTTSMAGIACLWSGRRDLALAAGGWLRNLWLAQPDVVGRGLHTSWRDGGLVTEYSEADASGCLVDVRKLRQWYFQYGIGAALLSSLAGATGDSNWLLLARDFLHASAHAAADRYQTPQSGKVGWGAAWTYKLSGLAEDAALSAAVADGLCALQNGDGSWLATGVYGGETADADSVTIDVTAEFATLQSYMGLVRV